MNDPLPLLLGIPDSISIALILLPGFLLTWAYTHFSKRRISLDEFTRTGISVLVGVVLLPISYLFLVFFSNTLNPQRATSFSGPDTWDGFTALYAPSEVFIAYSLTLLVAVIIGVITGSLFDHYMKQRYLRSNTKTDSWDYFHLHALSPAIVQVTSSDNKEIWGIYRYAGEETQDIIVQNPRSVTYNDGVRQFRKLGGAIYLQSDEVKDLTLRSNLDQSSDIYIRTFFKTYFDNLLQEAKKVATGPSTGLKVNIKRKKKSKPLIIDCVVSNNTNKRLGRLNATVYFRPSNEREEDEEGEEDVEDEEGEEDVEDEEGEEDVGDAGDAAVEEVIMTDWTEELGPGEEWYFRIQSPEEKYSNYYDTKIETEPRSDVEPLITPQRQWVNEEGVACVEAIVKSQHRITSLGYVETLWKAIDDNGAVVDIETVGIDGLAKMERRSITVEFSGADAQNISRVIPSLSAYWPITKSRNPSKEVSSTAIQVENSDIIKRE